MRLHDPMPTAVFSTKDIFSTKSPHLIRAQNKWDIFPIQASTAASHTCPYGKHRRVSAQPQKHGSDFG